MSDNAIRAIRVDAVLMDPMELPDSDWLEFDEAANVIAAALMCHDAYLANEHGAADTPSMKYLLAEAYSRYEGI
jgi:hypothetical protein